MKHLNACIFKKRSESFESSVKLENLKRKIEDDPNSVIKSIKKQYKRTYPSPKLKLNQLSWRKKSNSDLYLYDETCQQARFVMFDTVEQPIMIPPVGNHNIVPYNYSDICIKVPHLTKDVLAMVFEKISSWKLLEVRRVCKDWNHFIVNNKSLWGLKDNILPMWKNLSPIRQYVNQMFLNFKKEEIISFFFKRKGIYFVHIIKHITFVNTFNIYIDHNYISVNNYTLTREKLFYKKFPISIESFLESYRQCIQL